MPSTLLKAYQKIHQPDIEWHKNFRFYRFIARNHNPSWREGFFSRWVFNPKSDEYCVQVVSYYRYQLIPFHINDYHPFYIYYDKNFNPLRVLYDPGHHHSSVIAIKSEQQSLTVIYPWHPFEYGRKKQSLPLKPVFRDLTDEVLLKWWLQPGMPQFKLRSKFVDPWHPGLIPKDSSTTGTFRDEIVCPNCGKAHLFDRMDFDGKVFSLGVKCCNNTIITAVYDPENMIMDIGGIANG
jgi:hypothetical protein